ncbi:prohibitin family protein [Desulfosediminicola flagellatus]|uniref:prohibitin family protein n=1 Tax=Desulfosediminicola flagellatus TaxID=2569541 RepID=UPI0010ABD1FC|nr:prohibitin family protein [Desulfosediminicola flagellatus]
MAVPDLETVNNIFTNISRNWGAIKHRLTVFSIVSFLLCLVITGYFFNRIFINIYPGHAGVLWERFHGGTDMKFVYDEGLHIIPPWNIMYVYDIRNQHRPFEFEALSKDGLPIHFDVSARYRPDKEKLPLLHKTVGPDYVEKIVKPEVQAHLRKVVANYLPEEIYTSEGYLLQIIMQGAMLAIDEKHIVLDNLLIRKMTLPKTIVDAIERKLSQKQYVQELEYRLQSEAKEARRKAIEAEGIKRFQDIVKAGGYFDKYLQFKGINATVDLAKSNNSKVVVIGGGGGSLPLIMNMETTAALNSESDPAENSAVEQSLTTSVPAVVPKPIIPQADSLSNKQSPPQVLHEQDGIEPEKSFLSRLKQYISSDKETLTNPNALNSGKEKSL